MYEMYVKVVCQSRTEICKVSHKCVCAVRKYNETMDYKDFENSCHVFMHNFCDSPKQEYYIVTTGNCETYLQTRRNEDIAENEAESNTEGNEEVTEDNGEDNEEITEANAEVTENNNEVTEANAEVNDNVAEANGEVAEDNNEVTDGNVDVTEQNGENDATEIVAEESTADVVQSKSILRKATTKKAAAKATTKKGAATTKKGAVTTKKGAATTKKGAATTKKGAATTKKGAATTKKGAATTKKAAKKKETTEKAPAKKKLSKKEDKPKFVTLYEVDTAFDDHRCPLSCPDTYSPVCVSANRGNGMYFKFFTFVNHCSGDLYYCKNPDEFGPAPDESLEDVNVSKLGWSYCGASRYLQFARFSEAISSLGYYGWLAGDQKYSHIMEPYERKPGYG